MTNIDWTHHRIIPVLRKLPPDVLPDVVEALAAGGMRAMEVTMESAGAATSIAALRASWDGRLRIGAGTIMTERDVREAVAAGAEFLVCPHYDPHLLELARSLDVLLIPGVLTPSEIQTARHAGASVLKLFPASSVGPGYIKDVRGPFGDLALMATGGITEDNVVAYVQAGAVAVGMGSGLFPAREVVDREWGAIEARARRIVNLVDAVS